MTHTYVLTALEAIEKEMELDGEVLTERRQTFEERARHIKRQILTDHGLTSRHIALGNTHDHLSCLDGRTSVSPVVEQRFKELTRWYNHTDATPTH